MCQQPFSHPDGCIFHSKKNR